MGRRKKRQQHYSNSLKDYFSLSHRVRRGLLVLFTLMLAEIIILIYFYYKPTTAEVHDFSAFKKEIDDFYASGKKDSTDEKKESFFDITDEKSPAFESRSGVMSAALFQFNPNHLPENEWKRLGFSDRQIKSIKNYEAKGGTFRTKEDVKKMYAIKSEEFKRIEPFIKLPSPEASAGRTFTKSKKSFLKVDVGTADSTELDKLPMVGAYLAYKIFNYREKLGGYYAISQLKEVRGMRDSAYQIMLPHLELGDSTNLRRINLNTATFEDLNGHPYISSNVANVILAYRKQHGNFNAVTDVQKVALVDGELYRKIAPYLKVE